MKMLFGCFIVVLSISGKLATPVAEHIDIEASGETENVKNDDGVLSVEKNVTEQLNSENDMPGEAISEPIKRTKKSNYPSAPYPSAPYPSAPYPSAPYPSAPYPSAPYPIASYPGSSCPCSPQYAQPNVGYNAPQISYGQPVYGGYSAPLPGYGQPQYRPKYGRRKGNSYYKPQPSYLSPQPSYQLPQSSYQPQESSYQSPQPSYQQPQSSYQSPQPSYQHQSYQPQQSQVAYQYAPAPIYSASSPSYSSPSYNQGYSAQSPPQSYSYSSHAPSVQCGSNLAVGCHPHVSEVPCSGYSPSYGPPQQYSAPPQQYSAPAYRSNVDDSTDLASLLPTNPSNDTADPKTSPSKDTVTSIFSAPSTIEKGTNQENKNDDSNSSQKDSNLSASNQQALSPEEAKQKQYDTLMKMSELAKTLATDEKLKQLPSSNTQKTNEKPTLPGPPPTSMNVGMNGASSNQVNAQPFPQHSNRWV